MADLRTIWQPEIYHGRGKRPPFFEGWYFKLVTPGEDRAYAVIPGVFVGHEARLHTVQPVLPAAHARTHGASTGGPGFPASHAFVQILDGLSGETTYHRYALDSFRAARDELDLSVGPNRFRADHIVLDINTPERQMQGELRFSGLTPWPVSMTSPGIMGWYAFVPFMECYHGVISLDHEIVGLLTIDGRNLDFTGGRGYIEKDWGQAFPRAWIWMQSNHFGNSGISLTASVATIPWLGSAFRGFISGLWHGPERRLYRFATYTGASIERLRLTDDHVTLHVASKPSGCGRTVYRLEVVAWKSEGGLLHSPHRVAMLQRVLESLTARLEARLLAVTRDGEEVIFQGVGQHAGLEIVGELAEIVEDPVQMVEQT